MRIALIGCSAAKKDYPCPANEMYQPSALFSKAWQYLVHEGYQEEGAIFILSAKYGLLDPNRDIEPYDLSLQSFDAFQLKEWSKEVAEKLMKLDDPITQIDFYCGRKYRKYVVPELEKWGIKCTAPVGNLGIGQQLKFYTDYLNK